MWKFPISIFMSFLWGRGGGGGGLVQHTLEHAVQVLLPFLCIICERVALHFLDVNVLHLCPESGGDDSEADCLPTGECFVSFAISRVTPLVCVGEGGMDGGGGGSAYRITSPDDNLGCPGHVLLVQHRPSRDTLWLIISAAFPVDVPGGDLGGCLKCQKAGPPYSYHQAFTAKFHTLAGWGPF